MEIQCFSLWAVTGIRARTARSRRRRRRRRRRRMRTVQCTRLLIAERTLGS